MGLKAHKFFHKGVFFLSLFCFNFDDKLRTIFTDLLIYAYVGSHLMRILVFDDNYVPKVSRGGFHKELGLV